MQTGWRSKLGIGLLIYSCGGYGIAALIPFMGFSGTVTVIFIGGISLSCEIAFIASIALLGKPFIEMLKAKCKAWFAWRQPAAPARLISRRRHVIGITMLILSCLPYFIAEFMLIFDHTQPHHIRFIIGILLASDAMFVTSLFILGEKFWERLKKLFEWPGADTTSA